jgi:hypothetical protein
MKTRTMASFIIFLVVFMQVICLIYPIKFDVVVSKSPGWYQVLLIKVIQLSDSTCLRLLSCFGSLIIKKILKYQLPNVFGSVEIQMFIMSN